MPRGYWPLGARLISPLGPGLYGESFSEVFQKGFDTYHPFFPFFDAMDGPVFEQLPNLVLGVIHRVRCLCERAGDFLADSV